MIGIRNQEDIKRIKINDLESKLLQFADDTTVVLSNLDSTRALFVLLDCFEKVSWLKRNVAKTEAMWWAPSKSVIMNHLESNEKRAFSFFITCDIQILVMKKIKEKIKQKLKKSEMQ